MIGESFSRKREQFSCPEMFFDEQTSKLNTKYKLYNLLDLMTSKEKLYQSVQNLRIRKHEYSNLSIRYRCKKCAIT